MTTDLHALGYKWSSPHQNYPCDSRKKERKSNVRHQCPRRSPPNVHWKTHEVSPISSSSSFQFNQATGPASGTHANEIFEVPAPKIRGTR